MIASTLDLLGPWAWIVVGVTLAALELLAPGVFFLWLGIAAVLTGVVDAAFGLSWQASALVFAVLAVVSVGVGRWLTRRKDEAERDQPYLNRRGEALVGLVVMLDEPIVKGAGRIRVGDSVWRVTGPDLPVGASVRVTGVDGATLTVAGVQ